MSSNTGDGSGQTSHCSMEDEVTSFAMTLWTGSAPPMVLSAVIDLGVLEIIKKEGAATGGHMSPEEIAAHLPTKNPAAANMLDRLLRLLASYEVVSCKLRTTDLKRHTTTTVVRTYGLTPVCVFLTKGEDGLPVALLNQDKVFMECWFHLKDAVLDGGEPFSKAYGMNLFEYLRTDERFSKVFNTTMTKSSLIISKKLVENYNGFEGITTLVDVGGGMGTTLHMITSKYPSIKGINFDLPYLIQNAPPYPGVEHVAGDMFVSVPKGDAMFMKWILHDWTDEHCVKVLKNCYDALPSHGKVIICDYILPVAPDSSNEVRAMLHFDVVTLTVNPGGKERTKDEFEYLAKASGFKHLKIACSAYDCKVMELLKNI